MAHLTDLFRICPTISVFCSCRHGCCGVKGLVLVRGEVSERGMARVGVVDRFDPLKRCVCYFGPGFPSAAFEALDLHRAEEGLNERGVVCGSDLADRAH